METRFKILIIVLIFSSNLFGQTPTYGERKWIKTTLTDTAIINGGDVTLKKLTAKNATFADTVKADSIKVGNTWISTTTFLTKQNLTDTTTYDGTKNDIAIERNAKNDSILALRDLANSKTIYANNGVRKHGDTIKLDNVATSFNEDVNIYSNQNVYFTALNDIWLQKDWEEGDSSTRFVIGKYGAYINPQNNITGEEDSLRLLPKYEIENLANTKYAAEDTLTILSTISGMVDSVRNITHDTAQILRDEFQRSLIDTIIYAGTSPDGYILSSSNNGSTWTNNGSLEKGTPLDALYYNYLYYTTDQGYVINHNTGFYYNYSASPIRCITNHEDTLYAGNDAGNLIFSVNQGVSFALYSSIGYRINKLIYTDRLLCFTSNGIYRSSGTLVQAGNFTCALKVTIDTIYTVRADGYVFRSVNRGASWSNLGDFGVANSRFIEKGFGSRIIIGYTSTIMLYTDNQFSTTGSLSDQEPEAKCLVKTLNRIIIGQSQVTEVGGGMISYSTNNGVNFTNLGTQFSQDSINFMAIAIGSTYASPGYLTIYETKAQHTADTTLQRAWMDGLEVRKVNKGDTINRTAGSYITPTQAANLLATKVDTFDHVLEFDSAQMKGSSVFGNYLKNINGILKWGNYNVKTTNSVVQIHPLGLPEYVGNSVYFAYGVAARTQVVSNIEVNRIKVKLYLWTGTPACELRIYVKNTAFETVHPLSYNSTLIYSKTYAAGEFNTISSNYTIIDLPNTVSLLAGQWVFVSVAEAGTNAPALRMWTTQNSLSDRVSLLLCISSTGQYTSNWYTGGAGYYSTPILFEFAEGVTQAEFSALEDKVDSLDGVKQDIAVISPYMPDTIFTAIGRELNIYNDAFVQLRPDYKLEFTTSPNHGYAQNRGYRIMDTCAGLWSTTLTAKIYDENLSLLETKSCIIKREDTIPIAGSSSKKILVLGNSLTENSIWITELNRLLKLNKDTLTFLGTKGTAPNKHYATSGWSFSTFIGASSSFHISGITNVKAYVNDSCSSATLDYVIINLGINDVGISGVEKTDAQITTIVNNADSLVKSIRHATYGFPNCKIIISLSPIGNLDYDAYAVSYGSYASPLIYEKNLRKLHKALSTRYLNTTNAWVCPTYYNIDRTYGYTYTTTTKACARCSETITTHTNGVHPTTQGYMQMADIIFSYVRKALNSRK